jgi:integrase
MSKFSETAKKLEKFGFNLYACRTGSGHEYFTFTYRLDGVRKRESKSSLEDIEERAKNVAKLRDNGQLHAISLKKDDVEVFNKAQEIVEPTGLSLVQVCRDHVAILKELDGRSAMEAIRYYNRMHPKELKPMQIADVCNELYAAKERQGKTPDYVSQLRHQCSKFSRMFSKLIADVTADDLKLFIDSLGELSARTKNNVIAGVRELFSFAKKQKFIPKDFDQLEGVETFEDTEGEILIYTPAEMSLMMTKADSKIIPALAISAFAGLRASEVMALDWSEVDVRRRFITVAAHKAKTKQRRIVPMTKKLATWLAPYAKRCGSVLPVDVKEYHELRNKAAHSAGFEWRRNALRHSFCSYRLAQIKDTARVALEAGNSPQMIFTNYRELVRPADAGRWFAIAPKRAGNIVSITGNNGRSLRNTGKKHSLTASCRSTDQSSIGG